MLLLLLHCKWCWNTHIYGSIRKQHSNWSTDNSFFTSFEELNGKFKVYLILRGRWLKNIFQFCILDWVLRVILQFDNIWNIIWYKLTKWSLFIDCPVKINWFSLICFQLLKNILRFSSFSKCFAYNLGTFTAKIGNIHRFCYV